MSQLSSTDLLWLKIGLIPLVYVVWTVIRFGPSNLVRLRSIAIVTIWLQYHLSAWLSIRTESWYHFLLKPEYIDEGLRFSSLFLFAIMLGYGSLRQDQRALANRLKYLESASDGVQQSMLWLICIALLISSLTLITVNVGSLDEMLISSSARGAGQFREKTIVQSITAQFSTLALLMGAGAVSCAALVFGRQSRSSQLVFFPIVILFLILASSPLLVKFSRVSGALFFLFAVVLYFSSKTRTPPIFVQVCCICVGLYFCQIGISQRAEFPPGVWSFLLACLDPEKTALSSNLEYSHGNYIIGPSSNFLDALVPFTARLWGSDGSIGPSFESVVKLVLILQPLPSFLFGVENLRVGESLSRIFGTSGSTGLTTPSLAELYVLFGNWGALIGVIYGHLLMKVDRTVEKNSGIWPIIAYVMVIAGVIVSGHSGLRAFARPTVFAIIVMLAVKSGFFNTAQMSQPLRVDEKSQH